MRSSLDFGLDLALALWITIDFAQHLMLLVSVVGGGSAPAPAPDFAIVYRVLGPLLLAGALMRRWARARETARDR